MMRAARNFLEVMRVGSKKFSMIFPYRYFEIPWFFHDFGLFFKFHDFSRSGKYIFHFPGFPWFSMTLGTLMSSGRALEVQHFKCTSFLLHLHIGKQTTQSFFELRRTYCGLPERESVHLKMKCNIRMKRCTRSAMMCKISAHFPPIWDATNH